MSQYQRLAAACLFLQFWTISCSHVCGAVRCRAEIQYQNFWVGSKLFYVDDLRTGENRFFVKPFFWAAFFNKKLIFSLEKQNKKSESFTKKHFQENFSQKKRENQENIFWKFSKFFLNKNFFVSYFKRIYTKNQKKLFTKRLSRWIFYPQKCWIKFKINKGKTHFCRLIFFRKTLLNWIFHKITLSDTFFTKCNFHMQQTFQVIFFFFLFFTKNYFQVKLNKISDKKHEKQTI